MTAPWATCAACKTALYPRLARRADEGWVCAACPTCADCGTTLRPSNRSGYCRRCYNRAAQKRYSAKQPPKARLGAEPRLRDPQPCTRCGLRTYLAIKLCIDCRAVVRDLGEMDRWVA